MENPMKKAAKEFINHIRQDARKYDVKVYLSKGKYILCGDGDDAVRVSGDFNEEKMRIGCATNKPFEKWISILVHEYSHFEQWKDQCPAWVNGFEENGKESFDDVCAWIKGKKFSERHIKKCIAKARNLELDCERRTVKNIKKFNLPINLDNYIRGANAYIYFYNYMLLRRTWYKTGKEPYAIKEVCSQMPTVLKRSYESIPKKYVELYDKYCFG